MPSEAALLPLWFEQNLMPFWAFSVMPFRATPVPFRVFFLMPFWAMQILSASLLLPCNVANFRYGTRLGK